MFVGIAIAGLALKLLVSTYTIHIIYDIMLLVVHYEHGGLTVHILIERKTISTLLYNNVARA
jgi:hypothetical protein